MEQAIKRKRQLWNEWKKGDCKELTYKLRKIQREQSMQQRKLQKKKGLVAQLIETIVEKNWRLLMPRNTWRGKNIMKDSLMKRSLEIKKIWF